MISAHARHRWMALLFCCWNSAMSPHAAAEEGQYQTWNAKGQLTYVWQQKGSFAAAYSGAHSLAPGREKSYSFTATAYLGVRPWENGELYFNPEAAQGVALSGLTGLGGFSNGEIARTAGPNLTVYRARLFLRQTWGLGGATQAVEADANRLGGLVQKRRLVLTAGNLSIPDIFDDNAYSHDARTQFLNWSLVTHGAYDFAADARGYTWGAALEYYYDNWVLRAGRFAQPREPNQQPIDARIFQHYGDQVELEHAHLSGSQPGTVRLLAFRNRAKMSRFRDALDTAAGGPPDINAVRSGEQVKYGAGVNVEQSITRNAGVFARLSWADGRTETYAYTEIDRSLSAGIVIKGAAWGRGKDEVGAALAANGLSRAHRDYLAAGGLGFFLGDGRLNYRPEIIAETYYSLSVAKAAWVSAGLQCIVHPAYNADRGPVSIATVRLHAEF